MNRGSLQHDAEKQKGHDEDGRLLERSYIKIIIDGR